MFIENKYVNRKLKKKCPSVEWVSDCCLTPIQQFLSYIMEQTS